MKKWVESKRAAITPLAMVLVLIFFYALFQSVFVSCDTGIAGCGAFNAGYIFSLDEPGPVNESGEVIKGATADEAKNKEVEIKNRKLIAARYSGRYVWVFLAAVGTLLCIVAFIISPLLAHESLALDKKANVKAALLVGGSLLLGVVLYFLPNAVMPVMGAIFNNTIGNAKAKIGMPAIYETMRLLNAFSYAAAFSLVFASCAILAKRDSAGDEPRNQNAPVMDAANNDPQNDAAKSDALTGELDFISERMGYLKIILYVGTLLLIVGVLRMSALAQWAVSFIPPNAVDAAQSFNAGVLAVTGGFNTLLLAAVYLPAAYILQRRARLATSTIKPEDREVKLRNAGLTFSFRETLPRVLAILGPLLAGPIGELFKSIPT